MALTTRVRLRRRGKRPGAQTAAILLTAGFAGLIVLGTLLLLLPVATADGRGANLSTALFTATSAICVTGLAVVDTGSYWSRTGQVMIMALVELGGIGFGTGATLLFWLLGRNISLNDRLVLREILPSHRGEAVGRAALYIAGVSLLIQALGAGALFFAWLARYPAGDAAYLAVFHAVTAFCNAGFDVFGAYGQPGVSLGAERNNAATLLPLDLLVLLGGLGFPVLAELTSWRPRRRWRRDVRPRPPLSLHARLVLIAHIGLFVGGVALFWLLEGRNPASFGALPPADQLLEAINTSVFPRTAGFVTVPLGAFRPTSILVILVLMFIGSASAGTGGGVKVNTIAALIASVAATVSGRSRPVLFRRTLTKESIDKSLAIVVVSATVILLATLALTLTEATLGADRLLFEVVSAFSTVGLTLDITGRLSEAGRLIIEFMMFVGRLGPLTLVVLLTAREQVPRVTYAEEPVLVG